MRTILAFLLLLSICTASQNYSNNPWVDLLDQNLSQWEMYLSYKHKTDYKGQIPTDEQGNAIQPIGYNKNVNQVFDVIQENKELVLRVSGEYYGCVFTKKAYRNYHLKLKVKWGNTKWEPRKDKLMDAGILYHSQGDCGVDYWRAWMLSQEFQLMEGHFGDYWSIADAAIDIRAYMPEGSMNAVADEAQPFVSFGKNTPNMGYCMRKQNFESPQPQWTEVELICFEGKSIHKVNGKVVMILANSRYFDGQGFQPLIEGKIQLQSEACEVYYKSIQIKTIDRLPKDLAVYFE